MESCSIMHKSIKSSTGHVNKMIFSEGNKNRLRIRAKSESSVDFTWKYCAKDHEICHCAGTVRYGALGDYVIWDDLGEGNCRDANNRLFKRYDIATGQYGFSGTVDSCKQLCSKYEECVGINFIEGPDRCFLNVANGVTLPGINSRIYGGTGMGRIDGAHKLHWDGFWTCHRANRPGKWAGPMPVRGQINCDSSTFGADPFPGVLKKCECTSLEWEALGRGACLDLYDSLYRRQVLVPGKGGFTGTVQSCKQVCAEDERCVGINFVNDVNYCELNLGNGNFPGMGQGPVERAEGQNSPGLFYSTTECHRVVSYTSF